MKSLKLNAVTKIFLFLICFAALMPSQAQKTVNIEVEKLKKITLMAEKLAFYENENTTLIVENFRLKEAQNKLTRERDEAKERTARAEKRLKKMIWMVAGVLGVFAFLGFLRFYLKR